MAARGLARGIEVVDLRRISHTLLDDLLDEESAAWRKNLHWDFSSSAELVARYVSMRSLDGIALLEDGEAIGYSYYVAEEHKGLIGDLYIRQSSLTPQLENLLLRTTLDAIIRTPYIRRVEAQLMLMGERVPPPFSEAKRSATFPRLFMLAPLGGELPPGRRAPPYTLEAWTPRWIQETAALVERVYRGHIDSQINDQYLTAEGARRFLENIVHYPGCGHFFQPASWLATDSAGKLVGVSLASLVGPEAGHVTQICVAPEAQGSGLGYELLRRTMAGLRQRGCKEASLTVTAANNAAIELYENTGFAVHYRFNAHVWEGFI